MTKKITFIMVAYHANDKALSSLRLYLDKWSVIAIDNSQNNRGYGGGANEGIRRALRQGAEWVVVMNQDLKITKQGAEELQRVSEKSPPGIVGTFVGGLDPRRWTTILPSTKVDYISGACMAIHRDVIEKIGFFYEPYFMYYEDADYCVRAKKAGFPLIHASIAGIEHDDSPSLGKGSFLHEYYLARNHLLFVQRLAPLPVKFHELVRFPKTITQHYAAGNRGAMEGIADFVIRRFGERK